MTSSRPLLPADRGVDGHVRSVDAGGVGVRVLLSASVTPLLNVIAPPSTVSE